MLNHLKHHRGFERNRWIYKNGVEAPTQVEETKKKVETDDYLKPEDDKEAWLASIELEHGPETFRAEIDAELALLNIDDPSIAEGAEMRYTREYHRILNKLKTEEEVNRRKYNQTAREIVKTKNKQRQVAKSDLEDWRAFEAFDTNNKMPLPERKREMDQYFGKYVQVLADRYFNDQLPGNKKGYKAGARALEANMQRWTQNQLNEYRERNIPLEGYLRLKGAIEGRFERYANFDQDPSSISSLDLLILEKQMDLKPEQLENFYQLPPESILNRLEDYSLLHPEKWKEASYTLAHNVIKEARKEGLRKEFVEAVNVHLKPEKPVKTFVRAKAMLLWHSERLAKLGAKDTVRFFQKFSSELFHVTAAPQAKMMEDSPLRVQIGKQSDYLRSGEKEPNLDEDKTLIEFVDGGERKRRAILASPRKRQELLRAIKKTTVLYPKYTNKNLPKNPGETRRAIDISKSTDDDKEARLLVMITYGQQAEALLVKYSQRLTEKLAQMEEPTPANSPEPDVDFKNTKRKRAPRFRPGISRGGFTGTQLGLDFGKCLLGVLTVSNVLRAARSGEGKNWFERGLNGLGKTITDPHTIFAVGATVAAHKASNDERLLKLPLMSPREREALMNSRKLEKITQKVGIERRDRFVTNMAEWQVIKRLKKTQKFDAVMSLAHEKQPNARYHFITADLLVDAGVIEANSSLYFAIATKKNTTRMRYLMYENFFDDPTADPHHIKEDLTGSSYIADE